MGAKRKKAKAAPWSRTLKVGDRIKTRGGLGGVVCEDFGGLGVGGAQIVSIRLDLEIEAGTSVFIADDLELDVRSGAA